MTPAERYERLRALCDRYAAAAFDHLLPAGSVILLPDEVESMRRTMTERPWAGRNMNTTPPASVRFWEKVWREHESGCWLWQGTLAANGYGVLRVDGKNVKAHRFSYELLRGPIPEGATIDHLCRVRSCVNPDHLEAVSFAENCLRGEGLPAQNFRKTHCQRGHEFTPENTSVDRYGHRECITCRRERARAKYAADSAFREAAKARRAKSRSRA